MELVVTLSTAHNRAFAKFIPAAERNPPKIRPGRRAPASQYAGRFQ
jgi:hypothetical protein